MSSTSICTRACVSARAAVAAVSALSRALEPVSGDDGPAVGKDGLSVAGSAGALPLRWKLSTAAKVGESIFDGSGVDRATWAVQ